MTGVRTPAFAPWLISLLIASTTPAWAQQEPSPSGTDTPDQGTTPAPAASSQAPSDRGFVFTIGELVVVGAPEGTPGVGGAILTRDQMWTFERGALDQAVNVVPGVVSTLDTNGRRNESDIFVRGFGRWQVPLLLDGVRVYLPADNRLDFGRFLTADIAAVQIQKGYASVLDGPGAMGGAINLVTRKPTKPFEVEVSAMTGGRSGNEGWNGYAMAGTRRARYYVQGSVNYSDRDFWTLPGRYQPPVNSLQASGRRISSDSEDSRANLKVGFTPNDTDEYTFNYIRQTGEKGGPLNVYNNPPVPANSFWRWRYWNIQNTSFLSKTQLGQASYVKTRIYYNTMKNGLDAFDNVTYTTQSDMNRFFSPYDDHSYGASVEAGTTQRSVNTLKVAAHYRSDFHREQQHNRPTHSTLSFLEPTQDQAQSTWSFALEDTIRAAPNVDIVGGVSYENYRVTKAEEFTPAAGVFEYPKGGSSAFNWQTAVIWHYSEAGQLHASVSDRVRFPMIFELYSARMGAATPNPNLGPERATNVELGWQASAWDMSFKSAVFYSDVKRLIQTVILPDASGQYQNVGNGHFQGVEVSIDTPSSARLRAGGHYTFIQRVITDALLPNLRPTGVPTHKGFFYASWQPTDRLTITPSLDVAGDRWSDVNVSPAAPHLRTGAYTLVNVAAEYEIARGFEAVFGFKNMTDDHYELVWGFPQPGRTFYVKTRVAF